MRDAASLAVRDGFTGGWWSALDDPRRAPPHLFDSSVSGVNAEEERAGGLVGALVGALTFSVVKG